MNLHKIIVLPAPGCRRSRRILEYLEQRGVPFTRIPFAVACASLPAARTYMPLIMKPTNRWLLPR
jgi:hypothetical protein